MNNRQEITEKLLLGRTIQITKTIQVKRIQITPTGTVFADDGTGTFYKIGNGLMAGEEPFKYEVVTPLEWISAGQIWISNGIRYAAMENGEGEIVLRPLNGGDLYSPVYPDMYDKFLKTNPVLAS